MRTIAVSYGPTLPNRADGECKKLPLWNGERRTLPHFQQGSGCDRTPVPSANRDYPPADQLGPPWGPCGRPQYKLRLSRSVCRTAAQRRRPLANPSPAHPAADGRTWRPGVSPTPGMSPRRARGTSRCAWCAPDLTGSVGRHVSARAQALSGTPPRAVVPAGRASPATTIVPSTSTRTAAASPGGLVPALRSVRKLALQAPLKFNKEFPGASRTWGQPLPDLGERGEQRAGRQVPDRLDDGFGHLTGFQRCAWVLM